MEQIKLKIIHNEDIFFSEIIPECDEIVFWRETGELKIFKEGVLLKTITNFAFPTL